MSDRDHWADEFAYFDADICTNEGEGVLSLYSKSYADTQILHSYEFADDWWTGDAMFRMTRNWNPPRVEVWA